MAQGDLSISYGSTTVVFNKFSDEALPRAYLSQTSLEFSAVGAGYSTGPAKRQRKIWTVASYGTEQQVNNTFALFDAWDLARSTGLNNAQVSITDELFGSTITSQAFFTEAPAVNALASGNADYYLISFALTEV